MYRSFLLNKVETTEVLEWLRLIEELKGKAIISASSDYEPNIYIGSGDWRLSNNAMVPSMFRFDVWSDELVTLFYLRFAENIVKHQGYAS